MDIEAQVLDHYGIVSGICDEIGLVETINEITHSDPQRKVSIGTCVKAMIINGMGFSTKALYLTPQFYENKPIELMLDDGITAKDLNDDSLGDALDQLHANDCTKIFAHVATRATRIHKVDTRRLHGDTCVMQVYGKYNNQEGEQFITFGYEKSGRADLKQFLISLMVANDGAIPLLQQTVAGNTSDTVHFREVVENMKKNLNLDSHEQNVIFDAAFYCAENIRLDTVWITRVPEKLKAVGEVKMACVNKKNMCEYDENYSFCEVCTQYADVNQRWLVVRSKMAGERAKGTVARKVTKERKAIDGTIKLMQKQSFSCKEDAEKAAKSFEKSISYHTIKTLTIEQKNPSSCSSHRKKETLHHDCYQINVSVEESKEEIKLDIELKSMFVLATNELNDEKISTRNMLETYKEQYKVEHGFRFLKDPLCFTSSIYLKKTERIIALAMIMCLCLLVYSLAERRLRLALKESDDSVPSQTGKPTKKPTMKWIFTMFEGIVVVSYTEEKRLVRRIINLTETLKKVLRYLGAQCMKRYLMAP